MKKFLFTLLLVCTSAFADITQQHFSFNQVFDVQWYISNNTLYASGFNYIYASQPSNARLTSAQEASYSSAGDYIAFFNSTTNPGYYGLGVYSSSGTLVRTLDNYGTFTALANGAIFYNGAGSWGTLFTTSEGYSIGGSANFPITAMNPTNAQLQAYVPPTIQPLNSGQTATPSYVSNITTAEQSRYNSAESRLNYVTGNSIYITQSLGDSNIINITQAGKNESISGVGQQAVAIQGTGNNVAIKQGDPVALTNNNLIEMMIYGSNNILSLNQGYDVNGNYTGTDQAGHYQYVSITGNSNSVTTQQQGQGQYGEVNITGSSNVQTMIQTGQGNQLFSVIGGNNNTLNTTQTGNAQNFLDLTLTGNGNTAIVSQSGNTQNRATISITNAGGSAGVSLTQTGGQVYNVSTICITPSGCGTVTVKQGN